MKILCLHGAFSNGSNFNVQLLPFVEAVNKSSSDVEFKWANGAYGGSPPPGYADYFGHPPLYRFIDYDGTEQVDDLVWQIRDMSKKRSPEESMRELVSRGRPLNPQILQAALDKIITALDEDPEIDGIIGYSEGAMVAGSTILEEQRLAESLGRRRQIKYGIFFGGWPPLRPGKDQVEYVMADTSAEVLDIPTLHVIGSKDPYVHGALALYNVCDPDQAVIFDHGKGHTVPRDLKTLNELAAAVHEVGAMA